MNLINLDTIIMVNHFYILNISDTLTFSVLYNHRKDVNGINKLGTLNNIISGINVIMNLYALKIMLRLYNLG